MSYIRTLTIKNLNGLALKAKEREEDSKLFKIYCASLPFFEEPKSFNDWKEENRSGEKQNYYTEKSDEEIMREIEGIDL